MKNRKKNGKRRGRRNPPSVEGSGFTRDDYWIQRHFSELVEKYPRRYVAVVDEQIAAISDVGWQADEDARRKFPGKTPSVILIPSESDLTCVL